MKFSIPLSTYVNMKCKINSLIVHLKFYLDVFWWIFQSLKTAFMGKKNEVFETLEKGICYIGSKENGETEISVLLALAQESRACKIYSGRAMNSSITNYCHRKMFLYMNFDIENWMDFCLFVWCIYWKWKKLSDSSI